jgi:hypothetical protein
VPASREQVPPPEHPTPSVPVWPHVKQVPPSSAKSHTCVVPEHEPEAEHAQAPLDMLSGQLAGDPAQVPTTALPLQEKHWVNWGSFPSGLHEVHDDSHCPLGAPKP